MVSGRSAVVQGRPQSILGHLKDREMHFSVPPRIAQVGMVWKFQVLAVLNNEPASGIQHLFSKNDAGKRFNVIHVVGRVGKNHVKCAVGLLRE